MSSSSQQLELLAPAGQWDCLKAAVANGADAIYFGLGDFNARRRAVNFTLEELPRVMAHLHEHNVRGYVTFNTLIFSDELPKAQEYLRSIAAAGADAIIVQDLGVAALAHRLCPGLDLHASTQMTLSDARGIERARQLGISRVILARELSIEQIATIRRQSDPGAPGLEVFVHGALCISVSGQCLASQCLFGRSANRGQCDQPCRLPYELLADGRVVDTGERSFLLSPKDLAAYERIGQLVKLGISAFKIEGRLKGANYVAAAVAVYRSAIDAALADRPFAIEPRQYEQLEQSFSRGFCTGHLDGEPRQLVHGLYPNSRGSKVASVTAVRSPRVHVRLEHGTISNGDGLVIDSGRQLTGGRVFAVQTMAGGELSLELGPGDVDLSAVKPGQTVWKTDDPQLRREIEKTYARQGVRRRVRVDVDVTARAALPLELTWRDEQGHAATVRSGIVLEAARRSPLTVEMLKQQLGRLGETPFELGEVRLNGGDAQADVLAPKSMLNELRRSAVEMLMASRRQAAEHAVCAGDALSELRAECHDLMNDSVGCAAPFAAHQDGTSAVCRDDICTPYDHRAQACLSVLVRTMEQFSAVMDGPAVEMIYCDLADLDQMQQAVELGRQAGKLVALATLRIYRPGEEDLLERLADMHPPAVLVRNLSAIDYLLSGTTAPRLIGDFSLNVANELSAAIVSRWGLERLTASYDLDDGQLFAMLRHFPPGRLEIVIRQHVPMFHIAAGTPYLIPGRLGELPGGGQRTGRLPGAGPAKAVALRDRIGAVHPVTTDAAGRVTIYAERLRETPDVPALLAHGLRHFRVELLDEDATAVRKIMAGMQGMHGIGKL